MDRYNFVDIFIYYKIFMVRLKYYTSHNPIKVCTLYTIIYVLINLLY